MDPKPTHCSYLAAAVPCSGDTPAGAVCGLVSSPTILRAGGASWAWHPLQAPLPEQSEGFPPALENALATQALQLPAQSNGCRGIFELSDLFIWEAIISNASLSTHQTPLLLSQPPSPPSLSLAGACWRKESHPIIHPPPLSAPLTGTQLSGSCCV